MLPDSPSAREDFEWLKTEVKDAGGDASVFAANSVDTWSDDALVEEFRRARQDAYLALGPGDRRRRRPAQRESPETWHPQARGRSAGRGLSRTPVGPRAHRLLRQRRSRPRGRRCWPSSRTRTRIAAKGSRATEAGGPARPHRLRRTPVGHPATTRGRPHELGVADSALHRPGGAVRLRQRSGVAAGARRRTVRHVRGRLQSPG